MLTVIVPATSQALTTLNAVKAELGLSGTGDDAWLADTIARTSATIRRWCGRAFALETVRESFRLPVSTEVLSLSRWPVVSVVSVTEDGDTLAPGAFETEDDTGFVYRLTGSNSRRDWPAGKIVVEYRAGYVLPGNSDRTLPEDVEAACIALCIRAFHAKGRDPALRSYQNPDVESYSLLDPDKTAMIDGLPADVAGRLWSYRPVVL